MCVCVCVWSVEGPGAAVSQRPRLRLPTGRWLRPLLPHVRQPVPRDVPVLREPQRSYCCRHLRQLVPGSRQSVHRFVAAGHLPPPRRLRFVADTLPASEASSARPFQGRIGRPHGRRSFAACSGSEKFPGSTEAIMAERVPAGPNISLLLFLLLHHLLRCLLAQRNANPAPSECLPHSSTSSSSFSSALSSFSSFPSSLPYSTFSTSFLSSSFPSSSSSSSSSSFFFECNERHCSCSLLAAITR